MNIEKGLGMIRKIIIFLSFIMVSSFAVEVGKISMLRGEVLINRDGEVLIGKINTTIEKKDVIDTKARTKVQIVFNDETVVTLGSKTKFEVEDYLFDEQKQKIKLSVQNGSFKVITGKIGKLAPKNFMLKTKTSVIGVRGTIFTGKVGIGKSSIENISCLKGSIVVSSLVTNQTKIIDKGNMVLIKNDGSMGKVQAISEDNFSAISHLEESSDGENNTSNDNNMTNNTEEVQTEVSTEISKVENTSKINKKTEDNKDNKIEKKAQKVDFDTLVPKNVVYNYKGKLKGTSDGIYKTTTHTTEVKEKFKADMNMRINFNNNAPLKVKISNQSSEIISSKVNGKIVNDIKLPAKKDINMNMKQSIDRKKLEIEGVYNKTSGGLSTSTILKGKFTDVNASAIKGSINEVVKGKTTKGVDITRTTNGKFDVKKQ